MEDDGHAKEADTGVQALNRVLASEQQVAERIKSAKADAANVINAANREANRIAQRGDARIQALHACARKSLRKERKRITQDFLAERAAKGLDLTQDEIDRLVLRLARSLTGPAR